MKWKVVVSLAIAGSFLFLASCSNSETPKFAPPSSVSTNDRSEKQDGLPPPNDLASPVREFPLTHDNIIDSLNQTLSNAGYPSLENPNTSSDTTAAMGAHTAYTYSLGAESYLTLYEADESGNLLNFTVMADVSKASDDTMKYTQYLMGCLEGGIAGSDAERVDRELNLSNTIEDALTTASTSNAEFMYIVQGTTLTLMITPI